MNWRLGSLGFSGGFDTICIEFEVMLLFWGFIRLRDD